MPNLDSSISPSVDALEHQGEASTNALYSDWLQSQCMAIHGCYAAVLAVPNEQVLESVAVWPTEHIDIKGLSALLNRAIEETGGLVQAASGAENSHQYSIAYPVRQGEHLLAIIALSVQVKQKSQLAQILKLLEWGGRFFEGMQYKKDSEQSRQQVVRLSSSLTILTQVMSEEECGTSYLRLISELAQRLECDWVALGEVRSQKVYLRSYSNSSQQDHKMNCSRLIETAMEESFDQRQSLAAPTLLANNTTHIAQKALSEVCGNKSILTVPLLEGDSAKHVITLLRRQDKPFSDDDALLVESILSLIGPYLAVQQQASQSIFKTFFQKSGYQIQRLLGRGYLKRKLFVLVLFMLVGLLNLSGSDRLSADAVLIGAKLRVIVSPLSGYIKTANVRAGDKVSKGDAIFSLDDADLQLEVLKWKSQKAKLQGEYQVASAGLDRANMNIIKAQLDQVGAQLSLLSHQQARSVQRAPFDALVVSGDLSQRLGAQVGQGEVLFELSPLDAYRINLKVKQNRIKSITLGQRGDLHLSALPQRAFPFIISRLTPVTESMDGASYFIVEASLSEPEVALQPGMSGIAKVHVGEGTYLTLWTREWLDWMRVWYWSWFG